MARLLILAHRIPFPPNKGEKLRTFHQIEELVRKGHEVTVLAPYETTDCLADARALADKFNIKVVCEKLKPRIFRLAAAVLQNTSFSQANFYSRSLVKEFERAIVGVDSVLLTASSLAPYVLNIPAFSASNRAQKRPQLLMDFMDVDSDKWRQYAHEASFLKRLVYTRESRKIAQLEKATAKTFDTAYVIAEPEKKLFQAQVINSPNIKVLGNGIDQRLFNPCAQKPTDITNYLFSGVMDYKPNVDAMLWFVEHCWPSIVNKVPNAHLIIAGMNPNNDIVKLGHAANIEVTGFVDDIKPYFDRAHVFVAPFQIARGVQNKVLQAMACALPVVSTPLGAEGIACKDMHDILLANPPQDFIKHCVSLATTPNLQIDIGQQALTTINDHYAWESVLQALTSAIESLGESAKEEEGNLVT